MKSSLTLCAVFAKSKRGSRLVYHMLCTRATFDIMCFSLRPVEAVATNLAWNTRPLELFVAPGEFSLAGPGGSPGRTAHPPRARWRVARRPGTGTQRGRLRNA